MRRQEKAKGTLTVTGVGQAVKDLDGIRLPLSGEARLDGVVRQATVVVVIPNSLISVVEGMLKRPIEQIPLYRPELLRLNIERLS